MENERVNSLAGGAHPAKRRTVYSRVAPSPKRILRAPPPAQLPAGGGPRILPTAPETVFQRKRPVFLQAQAVDPGAARAVKLDDVNLAAGVVHYRRMQPSARAASTPAGAQHCVAARGSASDTRRRTPGADAKTQRAPAQRAAAHGPFAQTLMCCFSSAEARWCVMRGAPVVQVHVRRVSVAAEGDERRGIDADGLERLRVCGIACAVRLKPRAAGRGGRPRWRLKRGRLVTHERTRSRSAG